MAEYKLVMQDDGSVETYDFDLRPSRTEIEEACEEWVRGGDWGPEGARVEVSWTLSSERVVGWTAKIAINGVGPESVGTVTVHDEDRTDVTFLGDGPAEQDLADAIDAGYLAGEETLDDGITYHWHVLEDTQEDTEEEVEIDSDYCAVEVEPDHEGLIRAAGGDPDCDHDWTAEGEGGCLENPGVWSHGGTAMSFTTHCRRCGLQRYEYHTGSQCNPGEHDTVTYTQPEQWCADCQSEDCSCNPSDD